MDKIVLAIAVVWMIYWLFFMHPDHETLHKVAWELGVIDCILVAWSMFFSAAH